MLIYVVVTEDGIVLNDEMDDFGAPGQLNACGFPSSPINYPAPGKRPQSSISSSMAEDEQGNLIFATGAAGGSQIITATLQQLYHYLDQGLNSTASTVQYVLTLLLASSGSGLLCLPLASSGLLWPSLAIWISDMTRY